MTHAEVNLVLLAGIVATLLVAISRMTVTTSTAVWVANLTLLGGVAGMGLSILHWREYAAFSETLLLAGVLAVRIANRRVPTGTLIDPRGPGGLAVEHPLRRWNDRLAIGVSLAGVALAFMVPG